jgi:hypothetical protein
MLFVLTPLKEGISPPRVNLLSDDETETACLIEFEGCRDQVTFRAPRFHIVDSKSPYRIKTGMRMKWIRKAGDKKTVFTVPTLPGPYVKE